MKNPLLILKQPYFSYTSDSKDCMSAEPDFPTYAKNKKVDNIGSVELFLPLLTGENKKLGELIVKNGKRHLVVDFYSSGEMLLYETHLAVATSPDLLPYKDGHAIPGKFPYCQKHSPPVKSDRYFITHQSEVGTIIYIEAHAVLVNFDKAGYVTEKKRAWAYDGPSVYKERMKYFIYTI